MNHSNSISVPSSDASWEAKWSTYDPGTYQSVLNWIRNDDVVLEIGAGDLRLARQVAQIARSVIAIEIQSELVQKAQEMELPHNLSLVQGDARNLPFPPGVSVAILLMRHCTNYKKYINKLCSIGCTRLITNARWRMSVELIQLDIARMSYDDLLIGWYGCDCGAVGFKPGLPSLITAELMAITHEVRNCPVCQS
jgi:hypothetical protein